MTFDVAIVGGSFAGLSAALQLAAYATVHWFDDVVAEVTGPVSLHQAQLLPEWGSVTLFLHGAPSLAAAQPQMLAARGVVLEATPIAGIVDEARVALAVGDGALAGTAVHASLVFHQ